jgi:hypothetical protein
MCKLRSLVMQQSRIVQVLLQCARTASAPPVHNTPAHGPDMSRYEKHQDRKGNKLERRSSQQQPLSAVFQVVWNVIFAILKHTEGEASSSDGRKP